MIIKCTYGYVIHLFKPFHHLHQYGTVKKKNCNSIWIVISELVFNNSPQSYITTSICALWQFCFSDVGRNCIFDEGFGCQERSDRNLQCIYLFIYSILLLPGESIQFTGTVFLGAGGTSLYIHTTQIQYKVLKHSHRDTINIKYLYN